MNIHASQPFPALPVTAAEAEIAVYIMTTLAVVVVVGVVLPAVWSEKPARRNAARTVLEIFIRVIEALQRP